MPHELRYDARTAYQAICTRCGLRPWFGDGRSSPHCEVCGREIDHWRPIMQRRTRV